MFSATSRALSRSLLSASAGVEPVVELPAIRWRGGGASGSTCASGAALSGGDNGGGLVCACLISGAAAPEAGGDGIGGVALAVGAGGPGGGGAGTTGCDCVPPATASVGGCPAAASYSSPMFVSTAARSAARRLAPPRRLS